MIKQIYIFLFIFSVVELLIVSIVKAETVTVDYNSDNGFITYRASGFIGGITSTTPQYPLVEELKPKLFSWDRSFNGYTRAKSIGSTYQVKLCNKGFFPNGGNQDMTGWIDKVVKVKVDEAIANNYTNIEFDIWNEPEFASYWDGPVDERYFQMWIQTHKYIKSRNPNFVITGPSSTNFGWTLNTFLPRVKAENVLPDVLSWHELWSDGNGVSQRVEEARTYMKNNSINIARISINEYGSESVAKKPGIFIKFMHEFEKAKVDTAAKACWPEGGDWNCPSHLNNLLAYPTQQKRSVWWAYKSYADMTGRLVNVANSTNYKALATVDISTSKGYILLGNTASAPILDVVINNLDKSSYYTQGKLVKINIYHIPNTETNVLNERILLKSETINPSSNSLSINITNNANIFDAYFITLETANTPTTGTTLQPSPTIPSISINPIFDVNKDGSINLLDAIAILKEIFM